MIYPGRNEGIIPNDYDLKGNRKWKVTTAPTVEPVTTTELKTFARIDSTYEDTLLASFIVAARQNIEKYLNRGLVEQTITMYMDWFGPVIDLPMPPVMSVTSFKFIYEDGTSETVDSDYYELENSDKSARIILLDDAIFPTASDKDYSGYQFIYKSGYGALAANVPDNIKIALMLWASIMYDTRTINSKPPENVLGMLNDMRCLSR